jgi:hypothetical protein
LILETFSTDAKRVGKRIRVEEFSFQLNKKEKVDFLRGSPVLLPDVVTTSILFRIVRKIMNEIEEGRTMETPLWLPLRVLQLHFGI